MKKPAVALATAALMTLAACGGGGGSGNGDEPADTQTMGEGGNAGAFKNPDAQAPMEIPEGAQKGGTLRVDTINVPSTLDPTQAYYVDSVGILKSLVTRSLTQYAYNPETKDMQLIPDMATDLGRPNEDSTEWTFTLRDGLKYEDGTDVKAEDVAYAIKRSFAIEELPDGPTYQTTFFLDGDKYKGPFKDKGDYKGVVVNGNDITIKMRRPFTDMDYYAAFPAFTAIPEAKDNPATYGKHPLATGPYKFAEYKPGSKLTLVKNEFWDPETDPGRIQMVDGWEFNFGQDQAKLENVIINDSGSAQTTLTYDNVSAAGYRSIQEDKDRLVTGTSPCTYMWYIDMTKVTDLKVRKAIGWAYPYRAAWKAGGEIEGVTRLGGTSILPPGTNGRVEYDALGNGGNQTDPEKAKALLKEAGAMGYEIKFLFASDDALSVSAKDQIVKGLEAGGFKATPIASTLETIRTDRTDYDSPINVRSSGWCSDWPSGGSWFPAQWSGDLVGLEGMPNPANFKVAEMDKLQDHILDDLSPEEAAKAWGEFDKKMETEYYPAVNTGYSGTAMIHGSKVGGMENDPVLGMPTFSRMYVIQ
ncbi:MAG TPA: ABC transporter substrate-binding protein [Nocardioidaceae bacterium]|nr:ABC transporter substrate-binding protein [Nocardioidaceae bacterium]